MASAKVILYKNKKRDNNTFPLALRIIKDRKTKYIFLSVYIKENDWNEVECRVKKTHPNYKRINNLILKKLTNADDVLLEDDANEKDLTISQIRQQLKRENTTITFFQYAEEDYNDKIKQARFNNAYGCKTHINNFRSFTGNTNIFFQDIDIALLEKFKVYLKHTRNSSTRTIVNHLITIRSLFNKAIKEGLVERKDYPFGGDKIKIRIPSGLKIGLEEKEVLIIEALDLPIGTGISHTRNVWLFSFYFAGMRISDALQTKWTDFNDDRLYYMMDKNGKPVSVKVPDKVKRILQYYLQFKKENNGFVFPDLKKVDLNDELDLHKKIRTASRRFNKYLKKIAKEAKIDKNLSNHISRHSFGNIAGDQISPQMLQKLYRHSDIKTTMGYQANFIHKNADDALDAVLDF